MERDFDLFLAPYVQAVSELKVKLRGIRKQYRKQGLYSPIEFVTGRVKPVESILNKAALRGFSMNKLETEMQDIAGMRIMVQFVEDISDVVDLLRNRTDFTVVQERDYISNKKPSGYRSYHVIISYPVHTIEGEVEVFAEIQIRTLAMNFWATIEHSLNYKYHGVFPEALKDRLERSAEIAYLLDTEMSEIKDEIQEAQAIYDPPRWKNLRDKRNDQGEAE
ncbi:MAG: GTP pyrophosphokinase family protein [Streptococcaceae bacterium]|jgi:putative GTP pyrophosphokinase|nr:GTP pyrophosphokinase family protein [Streptococcaceae bacterium]